MLPAFLFKREILLILFMYENLSIKFNDKGNLIFSFILFKRRKNTKSLGRYMTIVYVHMIMYFDMGCKT